MTYQLIFTEEALKDIEILKTKGDKRILNKLASFFSELKNHPRTGTGQIERLKHYKEETFSRRLNREHRLIYQVHEETVTVLVLSTYGHYKDK